MEQNTCSLIFADSFRDRLSPLTMGQTPAALSFGGRYRLVDFSLSCLTHAGVCRVGVATGLDDRVLAEHLSSCREWELDRKGARLALLPTGTLAGQSRFHGRIDTVWDSRHFLKSLPEETIILAETTTLCNLDFTEALAFHETRGADITVIAKKCEKGDSFPRELIFTEKKGKKHEIEEVYFHAPPKKGSFIGLGFFIMKKKLLMEAVAERRARGLGNFEKDLLQRGFHEKEFSVALFPFEGEILEMLSPALYLKNNLRLTDEKLSTDLFSKNRTIFTHVQDQIPSFFAKSASLSDCIVADGCQIAGKLEDSVLSRGAAVGKGSEIYHSCIGEGCRIGKGCLVENAILGKGFSLKDGERICGTKEIPAVMKKESEEGES